LDFRDLGGRPGIPLGRGELTRPRATTSTGGKFARAIPARVVGMQAVMERGWGTMGNSFAVGAKRRKTGEWRKWRL